MNSTDERILELIKVRGRMTAAEIAAELFPDAPVWHKTYRRDYIWERCNSLLKYHWVEKTKVGNKIYWGMA